MSVHHKMCPLRWGHESKWTHNSIYERSIRWTLMCCRTSLNLPCLKSDHVFLKWSHSVFILLLPIYCLLLLFLCRLGGYFLYQSDTRYFLLFYWWKTSKSNLNNLHLNNGHLNNGHHYVPCWKELLAGFSLYTLFYPFKLSDNMFSPFFSSAS